MAETTLTYLVKDAESDPGFREMINAINEIAAIRCFCLLNKAGKIIVRSDSCADVGELIVYFIISCVNMRQSLHVKALLRIQLKMKDGTVLLIMPCAGKIIGVIIDSDSSVDEVAVQVRSVLLSH
jgi:hypothetical protein